MKKILMTAAVALVLCACATNEDSILKQERRTFTVYTNATETRTVYDASNGKALWKATDKLGLAATYGTTKTDATIIPFTVSNAGGNTTISEAEFTGSLTDAGAQTYTYYAFTPFIYESQKNAYIASNGGIQYGTYSASISTTDLTAVPLTLPTTQRPSLTSWDKAADFLVAIPVTAAASAVGGSGINFRFAHVFSFLKLSIGDEWKTLYGTERVLSVEISADKAIAGPFTLDITNAPATASDPAVKYTMPTTSSKKVTVDYMRENVTLNDLAVFAVLNAGTYDQITITINFADRSIAMNRSGLTLTKGALTSAVLSKKAEDAILNSDVQFLKALVEGHMLVDTDGTDKTPTMTDADWADNATIQLKFKSLMGLNYNSGEIRITSMDGTPLSNFPEKMHLPELTNITIFGKTKLTGKRLPKDWYTPKLERLRIYNTGLCGVIPDGLAASPNLKLIDANDCHFWGAFPHQWGNTYGYQFIKISNTCKKAPYLGYMVPAQLDVTLSATDADGKRFYLDGTTYKYYNNFVYVGAAAVNFYLYSQNDAVRNYIGFEEGWGQQRYEKYDTAATIGNKTVWSSHRLMKRGDDNDPNADYSNLGGIPKNTSPALLKWNQDAADAYTAQCEAEAAAAGL